MQGRSPNSQHQLRHVFHLTQCGMQLSFSQLPPAVDIGPAWPGACAAARHRIHLDPKVLNNCRCCCAFKITRPITCSFSRDSSKLSLHAFGYMIEAAPKRNCPESATTTQTLHSNNSDKAHRHHPVSSKQISAATPNHH